MALQGGIITRRPLCYSSDGRLLIAPCGSDIRVYSAKSGEHIATLRGHTAEVTAVAQDPASSKLVSFVRLLLLLPPAAADAAAAAPEMLPASSCPS
jgi:hypothetical protein